MHKIPSPQRLALPAGPGAAVTRQVNRWLQTSVVIQAVLIGLFALPLLTHAVTMLTTRPMADDYAFATIARERGVFGALEYWYTQWTGTPTSTIGQSLVALAGPVGNALAPILMLITWAALLVASVGRILAWAGFSRPRLMAGVLGLGTAWAVTAGIPNAYQSMYWTSGSVVYSGALVFLVLQLTLLTFNLTRPSLPAGRLWLTAGAALVIAVLIGGFTQTVAAMQMVAYGLGLVGAVMLARGKRRRAALILLGAALVGAVIALVIALVAPGNAVRQSNFAGGSLLEVGLLALQNTAAFFAISLSAYSAVPLLLMMVITALTVNLFGPGRPALLPFKRVLLVMGVTLAVGLLLILAYLGPAAYGMGRMPASRAWIVPQFVLTLVAVIWGAAIGFSLRRGTQATAQVSGFVLAVAALLLIAGPAVNTFTLLRDTPALFTYAGEWDARDAALRGAVAEGQLRGRVRPLVVDMAWYAGLTPFGTDELEGEFAQAIAAYYGMTELVLDKAP
jgi:hypothetical protein